MLKRKIRRIGQRKPKKQYPHRKTGEIFKYLPDPQYSNYYVSNFGRVWSFKSKKFLKPDLSQGKPRIQISSSGKALTISIADLVKTAFVPDYTRTPFADHTPDRIEDSPIQDGEIFMPMYKTPEYEISNFGRVWSNKSRRFIKPQPFTYKKKDGTTATYYRVRLWIDGKAQYYYVSRLVAYSFHLKGSYAAYIARDHQIHHIDRNPQNNRVDNLKRCTPAEHRKEHATK